jgi:hypothetical protein
MAALGEDARRVVPEPMPVDPTLHRDTSLSSTRFESVCGFRPRSVARALAAWGDTPDDASVGVSSAADRATR